MSDLDKQSVEYFLEWIKSGGLSQWIEHFLNSGEEPKLRQILDIFNRIKTVFGF